MMIQILKRTVSARVLPREFIFALIALTILAPCAFADQQLDLLVSTRRYREAVEYADARLPADKRTAAVWVNVGRANEGLSYNQKALENYLAALRLKPEEYDALLGAARLYNALGKHADAVMMADKAFKARGTADAGWELAKAHTALKNPAEAKKALVAVISSDTANVTANRELGGIYFADGEYARALPLLRRSYRADPVGGDAYRMGASFAELGMLDSASIYLKVAVERNAEVKNARRYLARIYFARKMYQASAAEYSRVDKDMMTAFDYHWLGAARDKMRDPGGALEAHTAAVTAFKNSKARESLLSREYIARAHIGKREYAAALPYLEFIAASDKRAAIVKDQHFLLAQAYAGTGQNDKAIESLERTVARDPKNIEVYAWLADLYERAGQKDRAKGTYDLMMSISPNDPAVFLTLGFYSLKAERWEDALRNFEKSNSYDRSARAFEGIAIAHIGMGDHAKSLEAARTALKMDPNLIVAREAMARSYIAAGDFEQAAGQAEWISRKDTGNVAYMRLLAECYEGMSNWAKLAEADKRIAAAVPKDIPSRLRLAKYAESRGDRNAAIAAHREIIAIDSVFPESHKRLAPLLRARDNLPGALAHAQKYTALRPNDAEGFRELGDILYDQKKLPAALEAYRKAVRLDPKLQGFHRRYAEIVIAAGQTAEVVKALKGVIDGGEANAGTYAALGIIYSEQKKYRDAIAMFTEAVKLDTASAETFSALGNAQVIVGDTAAAVSSLERAVTLKPKSGAEYKTLGDIYFRQKKDALGLAAYMKYLDNTRGGDKTVAEKAGRVLYENKKYADAVKYLALAESSDPAVVYMYAESNFHLGNVKAAITALEKLRDVSPQILADNAPFTFALLGAAYEKEKRPDDAGRAYAVYIAQPGVKDPETAYKAAFLLEKTEPEAAVRIYEDNIKKYPKDIRNPMRLGLIYARQKETLEKAVPLMKRCIAAADTAPRLWLDLALIFNALGGVDDELAAYRKYMKADSAHAEANKRAGAILLKKGAADTAMVYIERAMAAAPDDPEVLLLAAQGYGKLERVKEAAAALEKAKALKPKDIEIRNLLYDIYTRTNQKNKAFEEIKQLAEMTKDSRFMLIYGETLIARGKVKDAEAIADNMLTLTPGNVEAMMLLGRTQRARKDWDAAIDTYKKISDENPDMALPYYERAETYMQAGKPTWGETFYKRALRADPKFGLAELGLAKLYKGRKQMDLYKQHLEAAKKLMPDDRRVIEELKRAGM